MAEMTENLPAESSHINIIFVSCSLRNNHVRREFSHKRKADLQLHLILLVLSVMRQHQRTCKYLFRVSRNLLRQLAVEPLNY